jgi:hypothetical protein
MLSVPAPGVLGNDLAARGATVQTVIEPAHGQLTLNADGSFDYQPGPGFVGDDAFAYRFVVDGITSDVAVVHITVGTVPINATTSDTFTLPGSTSGGAGGDTGVNISDMNVRLNLEWVVPTLTLSVPGFIVIMIVLLQLFGGAIWLPAVKRSLSGLGVSRPGK